jgi:hypothetical protein
MGRASQEKGASLEREIEVTFGARAGVVVHRNMVAHATLKSGAQVLTGLGGKGAPDFMIEVRDPRGRWVCVWVESKNGDHAKLTRDQRDWHAAAALLGRHVVLARSIHDVVGAVERVQQGAMP